MLAIGSISFAGKLNILVKIVFKASSIWILNPIARKTDDVGRLMIDETHCSCI